MQTIEQIKPVEGFPGYEISNYGYVISYKIHPEGYVLKNNRSSQGYAFINLPLGKKKQLVINVHKLIVKHFIETDYKVVNHIDGNKMNPHIDNLQPCTQKQNIHDAMKKGFKPNTSNKKRPIIIYDPIDDLQYECGSLADAARLLNVHISAIYNGCKGMQKTVKGFKVSYKISD